MHAEQTKEGFQYRRDEGSTNSDTLHPVEGASAEPFSVDGPDPEQEVIRSQASRLITLIFLARTPHNKAKEREGKPNFVKPRAVLAIFIHSCKATRYDFQFEGAPSSAKSLQS